MSDLNFCPHCGHDLQQYSGNSSSANSANISTAGIPGDELYAEAVRVAASTGKISTALLQKHLKIGYGRAARIVDDMVNDGLVSDTDGANPRKVYINKINAYLESLQS